VDGLLFPIVISMSFLPTNERVIEWFERVWNQMDEKAIGELLAGDGEVLGLGTTVLGQPGLVAIHRAYRRTFHQIRVEMVDLVSGETDGAGHVRFSAVHRANGAEVDVLWSFAVRLEGGRIGRIRHVIDHAALLSQIGTFDLRAVNLIFDTEDTLGVAPPGE
jgi:ketosteroid isomerase-like protein